MPDLHSLFAGRACGSWHASRVQFPTGHGNVRRDGHTHRHARSTHMNHAEMQFLNTDFPYKKAVWQLHRWTMGQARRR